MSEQVSNKSRFELVCDQRPQSVDMMRTTSCAPPEFATPESKRVEISSLCPLKRQLSCEDDADDEEEDLPRLDREDSTPPLQPRKLDLEQHVSFGSEEEDRYVEKAEEEEQAPATQKYEPPEELEEGEISRTLTCPENAG